MQWWFKHYYSKPRPYNYANINILIQPGVFPPSFTFSTKILLDYLSTLDIREKTLLELGCGSGIISLLASKKGAHVTASDINEKALEELKISALNNSLNLKIVTSDLFDNIQETHFDYIVINPPFYPRKPIKIEDNAWYCGDDFEYFQKLFLQLKAYIENYSNVIMILSEDCNIERISSIAHKNDLDLKKFKVSKSLWETNYLFNVLNLDRK